MAWHMLALGLGRLALQPAKRISVPSRYPLLDAHACMHALELLF
jgi:hypothetical protein